MERQVPTIPLPESLRTDARRSFRQSATQPDCLLSLRPLKCKSLPLNYSIKSSQYSFSEEPSKYASVDKTSPAAPKLPSDILFQVRIWESLILLNFYYSYNFIIQLTESPSFWIDPYC